ncbi:Hypothetical protein, putative [Bodo saltans]|uniref:Uncharacterized protein n=1 Tax=Bodo saltans TaxID=75058 RepID=A0A0S4IS50_BODSA|nr:Hypothetical protein, putative [Bodo saltans]|eukprot:CUF48533.1 Hypothetical protein, putative [Bodo saltans]
MCIRFSTTPNKTTENSVGALKTMRRSIIHCALLFVDSFNNTKRRFDREDHNTHNQNTHNKMDEKPDAIEARAVMAESNGEYAKALAIRERLLLALQKLHGDPCDASDDQKIKICELICLLATQEQQSNMNSLVQGSMERHRKEASSIREYGEPSLLSNHPNRLAQLERNSLQSVHQTSSFLQSRAAMKSDGVVTKRLSLQGLLAFGERLISKENTLPTSQRKPALRQAKANLLMLLVTVLYRQNRPRAALPLAQAAQLELLELAAPPERASLDVATGYLTLSSVLSASNKHKEALKCAFRALEASLVLEERFANNDSTLSRASHPMTESVSAKSPSSAGTSGRISAQGASLRGGYPDLVPDGATENAADDLAASRVEPGSYLGSLLAACYHNIGTEQEHLSLLELALRTYGLGFRMAKKTHGDAHPLVERMYSNYCSVFQSVNYKHFYPDGHRPGETSTALENADRAVRQLNFSFLSSHRHELACQKETRQQNAILSSIEDPVLDTSPSHSQHILVGKIRSSSANVSSSVSHLRSTNGGGAGGATGGGAGLYNNNNHTSSLKVSSSGGHSRGNSISSVSSIHQQHRHL